MRTQTENKKTQTIEAQENIFQRAINKIIEVIINEIKFILGNIYGFIKFLVMIPIDLTRIIVMHLIHNRYKYLMLIGFIAYLCHIYSPENVARAVTYTIGFIIFALIVTNIGTVIGIGLLGLALYGLYNVIVEALTRGM